MQKKILILIGILFPAMIVAQQQTEDIDEMKMKLNSSGSHFLKWTFSNQTWLRFNESNPGTTVLGDAKPQTFDIGLRRTRIQFFGQLTDHVFFYTQFGQNNFNFLSQNAGNRKLQAFFHDALIEYKVFSGSDRLKFGSGLTIANGLSRFSQPSVSTIMTMDVPVFAQATVDQTDEFSRKLSVYARGQLGKLDYRLVLSDPFPVNTSGVALSPINENASFVQAGHTKQYQAFFIYNIFDKEPHLTPYMPGTYLGKKKVLNIEAGLISQRNATWDRLSSVGDTIYNDMKLWSIALYYDAPLNQDKGTAISAYAGYFNYDFGPGYLRYSGSMNPANGINNGPAAGSQGNSFPMFGTGNIFYTQFGYLFGGDLPGEGALMPYASLMSARYERVKGMMNVWSFGLNWLIQSHSSKLTLDYQLRPVYESVSNKFTRIDGKSQIVLQYQIYF